MKLNLKNKESILDILKFLQDVNIESTLIKSSRGKRVVLFTIDLVYYRIEEIFDEFFILKYDIYDFVFSYLQIIKIQDREALLFQMKNITWNYDFTIKSYHIFINNLLNKS